MSYLTCDQLEFIAREQIQQLKDCARSVYEKRKKIMISEMFSYELKVAANFLLKWFNAEITSNNLELSLDAKIKYEIENPINWQGQRCCICTFLLKINAAKFDADNEIMSYVHFIIFKEHMFLRNIFSDQELAASDSIKDLKNFHLMFCRFLKIASFLPYVLNTCGGGGGTEFNNCCFNDEDLSAFYYQTCADCENSKGPLLLSK